MNINNAITPSHKNGMQQKKTSKKIHARPPTSRKHTKNPQQQKNGEQSVLRRQRDAV